MSVILKPLCISTVRRWECAFIRHKSTEVRMAKVMKKYIQKHNTCQKKSRSQFTWVSSNPMFSGSGLKKKVFTEGQQRRAGNVGKVLYDYLTQLVNSGELSPYLALNTVEITRVKVVPDLSTMNVYWSASGTSEDDKTQDILRQNQGKLRYLLTSYHLLSSVPHITFVKDKVANNYQQVEELLQTADFGPDFVPSETRSPMRTSPNTGGDVQTITKKFDELSMKFENNNNDSNYIQTTDENVRNNLYGINHDEMMRSLILTRNKSRSRSADSQLTSLHGSTNQHVSKHSAQVLKKPKVMKLKRLVQQYEREHCHEDNEEELDQDFDDEPTEQ